jgi:hypothetical protein
MKFTSPKIEVGSIIVTFRTDQDGITPKKLYIVERRENEHIFLRNDKDQISIYRSIHFFEADVVFAVAFYMTLNRLLSFEKF